VTSIRLRWRDSSRSAFASPAVRDEPETLEDQLGDRLRSRLYEMCDVVPMYGVDYRRLQAERSRDVRR
jgi:hypothetical protein